MKPLEPMLSPPWTAANLLQLLRTVGEPRAVITA